MKKMIALLMLLLMALTVGALAEEEKAAAETEAFDMSVLEMSPFYTYDKFDKTWGISAEWQNDYGAEYGTIALKLSWHSNYYEKNWTPVWEVYYYDYANKHYNEVKSFQIIINDKLYTFGEMSYSNGSGYCFGGHVLQSMLYALETAGSVDFRIGYVNEGGVSREITVSDFSVAPHWNNIIELGRTFREANVWKITNVLMLSVYDSSYGATIE